MSVAQPIYSVKWWNWDHAEGSGVGIFWGTNL